MRRPRHDGWPMILVTGTVRLRPDARARMEEVATEMIAASNAEPGCHVYRYAFDLQDPDVMQFHEEYEDEAALASHFASDHMVTFMRATKDLVAERPRMTRWTAEGEPLGF